MPGGCSSPNQEGGTQAASGPLSLWLAALGIAIENSRLPEKDPGTLQRWRRSRPVTGASRTICLTLARRPSKPLRDFSSSGRRAASRRSGRRAQFHVNIVKTAGEKPLLPGKKESHAMSFGRGLCPACSALSSIPLYIFAAQLPRGFADRCNFPCFAAPKHPHGTKWTSYFLCGTTFTSARSRVPSARPAS